MIYDYVGQSDLQELPALDTYSQQCYNGDYEQDGFAYGGEASYDYPPDPPTYEEAVTGYQQK